MPNCTKCGTPGAYLGLVVVECPNPGCEHYKAADYVGAIPIRQGITVLPMLAPQRTLRRLQDIGRTLRQKPIGPNPCTEIEIIGWPTPQQKT